MAETAHRPCFERRCKAYLSTTISRRLSYLFEQRAGALGRNRGLARVAPSTGSSRVCSSTRVQIHVDAQSRHHTSQLSRTNRTHSARRRCFVLSLPVRSLGKYQYWGRTPLRLESQMVIQGAHHKDTETQRSGSLILSVLFH